MSEGTQDIAVSEVILREFQGLLTNADKHDVTETHAVTMLNVTPIIPGQLTVRKGNAAASFTSSTPSPTKNIISMYKLNSVLRNMVIAQVDGGGANDGIIRVYEDPS